MVFDVMNASQAGKDQGLVNGEVKEMCRYL